MVPAYSYEIACRELANAFRHSSPENVRMVGLLFARPESSLASSEIVPNLDYYHHRSGKHIDFFCAGYGQYWENWRDEFPDQRVVSRGAHVNWLYSPAKFNSFREEIERMTKWRYSGAADLVLTNGRYDSAKDLGYFDFSTSVVCQLDQMKKDGAILSVETFFENVFRFADSAGGDDPTWGFSDTMGYKTAGSAFKRFILSLMPKKLGEDVNRVVHFSVQDIGTAT